MSLKKSKIKCRPRIELDHSINELLIKNKTKQTVPRILLIKIIEQAYILTLNNLPY